MPRGTYRAIERSRTHTQPEAPQSGSLSSPHGGIVGELRDRRARTDDQLSHSRGEPASGSSTPTDQRATGQYASVRSLAYRQRSGDHLCDIRPRALTSSERARVVALMVDFTASPSRRLVARRAQMAPRLDQGSWLT